MADKGPDISSWDEEIITGKETVIPSPQTKESPKWKETKIEAKTSLLQLKTDIEKSKMSFNLAKTYLESLKNTTWENKPFILWGILSWLNQRWISIEWVQDGKIILKAWVQSQRKNLDIATYEETIAFQSLINNYLNTAWGISIIDLNKALMYRTSSIDNYLNEKVDWQKTSTNEYAGRLMERYSLNFKKYWIDISLNKWWITIKKEQFKDEQTFLAFRESVKLSITDNQADKEFLLTFFDDIYYNDRKWLQEDAVENYKKSSHKIESGIFSSLNKLTEEQKYSLWIKSEDDATEVARKWKNNPLEAAKEAFNNWGWLLGIILWIIWSIFWWGKWFLWGAVLWMWIAGGWLAMAGEAIESVGNKGKKTWNTPSSTASSNGTTSLFDKFKWKLEWNSWSLDKAKTSKLWDELSKNDKFLSSKASDLSIFETQKDETELKKYFESIGIELKTEDKEHYKFIFAELLKDRKSAIWDSSENETIKTYLERTSKIVAVVAAWSVAWWTPQWPKAWEKEWEKPTQVEVKKLSDWEKKQILTYFKIDENKSKDLISNLDTLWLDLFKLLNWYKKFIETKLAWLDGTIKNKIITSIWLKVWLINWKIDELKVNEKNPANFKNNRWIINNQIKELFEKTNNQILPSAYVLINQPKTPTKEQKQKIDKINQMFQSDITSDWDFNKTWTSFEIIDANTNNWKETFDLSDEKDLKFIKWLWDFNENDLTWLNLLNKADEEIESNANMWYMAWLVVLVTNDIASFTWVWTIPWGIFWWTYWAVDAFKDEDLMISILKTSWAIPEEYRTDKRLIDNILAWVWAIPLLWQWTRLLSKWAIVSKYISKLSPEKLAEFTKMQTKVSEMIKNSLNWVKDASKVEKIWNAFKWIFENKFILKKLTELENGKSIKIWELELTKMENGRFKTTIDWVKKELDAKQVNGLLKDIPIEIKNEFVVASKKADILKNNIWQIRKIDWHEVEVLKDWSFKIRKKDGSILNWSEHDDFIIKNIDNLSKEFKWISIIEWWTKVKEWVIAWYEKYWIKTFWDYLEKAWYSNGAKSEFFKKWQKWDFLWWIVLTPATTIRQLISAIPKGEWENIFRIMIGWNKNIKVWWHKWSEAWQLARLWNSWLTRAWIAYEAIRYDDNFDTDTRTGDEIWDYAFYAYWGIVNTIAAKYMWIID